MVRSRFVVIALLIVSACGDDGGSADASGSGSGTPTSDGSTGSSSTTDPTQGTTIGATASSTGEPTPLGEFCDAVPSYLEQCDGMLDECDRATLETCLDTFALERDELLQARATCGFPDTCFSLEPYEQQLCLYENTQDMAPTEAQLALADDLCASCYPDDDACLDTFFFIAEPVEGGAGVSGLGSSYLGYVDAFVEQLADQCVPPPGDDSCVQLYLDCLEAQVMQTWPAATVTACEGPSVTTG